MVVVSVEDGCPSEEYEPAFTNTWLGTNSYCIEDNELDDPHETCEKSMWAIPSVSQSNLNGKVICGKRSQESFVVATRPSADNICPGDMLPCSPLTSAENTICIDRHPEDAEEASYTLNSNCPITSVSVSQDLELSFSKTDSDNLPI